MSDRLLFGCWYVDTASGRPVRPAVPVVVPNWRTDSLESALWRTRSTKTPYRHLRARYQGKK